MSASTSSLANKCVRINWFACPCVCPDGSDVQCLEARSVLRSAVTFFSRRHLLLPSPPLLAAPLVATFPCGILRSSCVTKRILPTNIRCHEMCLVFFSRQHFSSELSLKKKDTVFIRVGLFRLRYVNFNILFMITHMFVCLSVYACLCMCVHVRSPMYRRILIALTLCQWFPTIFFFNWAVYSE